MSSGPPSVWRNQGAASGTMQLACNSKSARTVGSAFSFSVSEALVCWMCRWQRPAEKRGRSGR